MAVKIIKNAENPETTEILAESIVKIANGFEGLLNTPLNEDAIVALLKDMPGTNQLSKSDIRSVLQNLKTLKGYYLRQK